MKGYVYLLNRWQHYHFVSCLVAMLLLLGVASPTAFAESSVDGLDYAPNVYYQSYNYLGEGNEFAGQVVHLQYPPNEEGVYQFSVNNGGVSVVFIYQLSSEGVYELAYFPEVYEAEDLRQHPDATDAQKSLILPKELTIGQVFNRGYHGDQAYQVVDILPTFTMLDATYYHVVVIEPVEDPEGGKQRYYYAPEIGHIMDEFEFTEEPDNYSITTRLDTLKGPTYVSPETYE